jgi:hypothetical protein
VALSLIEYIKGQMEHHRRETFLDEYRRMLTENGIVFDERYSGVIPYVAAPRLRAACFMHPGVMLRSTPGYSWVAAMRLADSLESGTVQSVAKGTGSQGRRSIKIPLEVAGQSGFHRAEPGGDR